MKTEEEIVKGLEVCTSNSWDCENGCPYYKHKFRCVKCMMSDALNLIREKNAEIERLNAENMLTISERNAFRTSFYEVSRQLKHAKSEAVREFAERLKGMKYESIGWSHGEHPYVVEESDIDDIAEEMAGDNDEN